MWQRQHVPGHDRDLGRAHRIARTGRELIGADELGYLIFSLTARGKTLLAHAHGNQLGARVTITQTLPSAGQGSVSPTPTTVRATANIALVRFS